MNFEALCLLGAFFSFILFLIGVYDIHRITKEIEKTEAELKKLQEH